jgi:translation initiation factor 2 alpha subunit (eIF-2alpha)
MENNQIKEEDLVSGIVTRIESNTVFVNLEDGREGTIIISEIAPGRIKNLREYVVPNKKIVCKVLRLQDQRIDLSLRRVSSKEKKDFLEKKAYEISINTALDQILGQKSKEIVNKILSDFNSLKDFAEKSREDKSIIKKYIPEKELDQIEKILSKKQKEIEVKKLIKVKSLNSDGIIKIKEILSTESTPEINVVYITAGTFKIKVKGEDYKIANQKLDEFIKQVEIKAKKESCEFESING